MVQFVTGTVFDQKVDAIVNTINVVGVMGAGLALEFAMRYPKMLKKYEEQCKEKILTVGQVYYYNDYLEEEGRYIINFPTKWHFKYPSQLEWIEQGLDHFVKTYQCMGIQSVAFPKLGTRNGGLNWDVVKALMEKYLAPLDILVYICLDIADATGLEKKMIDVFNNTNFLMPIAGIKLRGNQAETLENAKPIKRFGDVQKLEGIGITTYIKLHQYCRENNLEQLSLF